MNITESRTELLQGIKKTALLEQKTEREPAILQNETYARWWFDFRRTFSHRKYLELAGTLFWEGTGLSQESPIQIGGLESAALPLITSCVLKGQRATGFFIRKSRKKKMQLRLIEGETDPSIPVVLVDDVMNSGASFVKQIEALRAEGYTVTHVFAIVRFHDLDTYTYFKEHNIQICSLYTLQDFDIPVPTAHPQQTAATNWYFKAKNPHLFEQGQRNTTVVCEGYIYQAADNGTLYKIDEQTGAVVWEKKLLFRTKPTRQTYTSVVVTKKYVCVTTYRGELIIVHKENGQVHVKDAIANTITTTLVASNTHLYFGVSDGTGSDTNTLVSFDLASKKVSTLAALAGYPQRTIVFDPFKHLLYVSTFSGQLTCYSNLGTIIWEQTVPHIKSTLCFNSFGDVAITTSEGQTVVMHREHGSILDTYSLPSFINTAPVYTSTHVYGATLDREIFCFDIGQKKIAWSTETSGRMYTSPTYMHGLLYVGDNNGYLHVLDAHTGMKKYTHVFSERITEQIHLTNKHVIVPTFANEIYALARDQVETNQ